MSNTTLFKLHKNIIQMVWAFEEDEKNSKNDTIVKCKDMRKKGKPRGAHQQRPCR